jgi:alkanesulfonate monooxygenase SsuD/methylene tetrahydromethanopterin reductase-like flavin-dependent oxidoreductase (luciferase family)
VVDVALMVEGQRGMTWPRWQRLVRAAEQLGFAALYRSDHLIEAQPPDEATLELWTSLTWLACNTTRLEFGQLVSPLTYRHPVHLAQSAVALDQLSSGRFTLGIGAGWSRREHDMYGFEMYSPSDRLDRMEEGLRILTALLRSDSPLTFQGKFFTTREAILASRANPAGTPQLLVAGRGRKRSLPLAACYADQWNVMFVSPDELRMLNDEVDALLQAVGRKPPDLRRTVMQGVEVGRTEVEIADKRQARAWQWWREPGLFAGLAPQLRQTLKEFERAGADRVILQWQDLDDVDALEILAAAVL